MHAIIWRLDLLTVLYNCLSATCVDQCFPSQCSSIFHSQCSSILYFCSFSSMITTKSLLFTRWSTKEREYHQDMHRSTLVQQSTMECTLPNPTTCGCIQTCHAQRKRLPVLCSMHLLHLNYLLRVLKMSSIRQTIFAFNHQLSHESLFSSSSQDHDADIGPNNTTNHGFDVRDCRSHVRAIKSLVATPTTLALLSMFRLISSQISTRGHDGFIYRIITGKLTESFCDNKKRLM